MCTYAHVCVCDAHACVPDVNGKQMSGYTRAGTYLMARVWHDIRFPLRSVSVVIIGDLVLLERRQMARVETPKLKDGMCA